jgi:hypothetical protein
VAPRLSMAKAMRAWGDLKPNAMRVMSLIFVFMDSMRPLETVFDGGQDAGAVFDDGFLEFPEGRYAAALPPADPFIQCLEGVVIGQLEDCAEAFLEVVRPPQLRVGLHDPGKFGLLLLGEVLRVLPERVA